MNVQGKKFDSEKIRMDLLPAKDIKEIAKVLTFGAKKYSENSGQNLKNGKKRYLGAALRHIYDYLDGEKIDPESGLSHLAHAATSLLFIIECFENDSL